MQGLDSAWPGHKQKEGGKGLQESIVPAGLTKLLQFSWPH